MGSGAWPGVCQDVNKQKKDNKINKDAQDNETLLLMICIVEKSCRELEFLIVAQFFMDQQPDSVYLVLLKQ